MSIFCVCCIFGVCWMRAERSGGGDLVSGGESDLRIGCGDCVET